MYAYAGLDVGLRVDARGDVDAVAAAADHAHVVVDVLQMRM